MDTQVKINSLIRALETKRRMKITSTVYTPNTNQLEVYYIGKFGNIGWMSFNMNEVIL